MRRVSTLGIPAPEIDVAPRSSGHTLLLTAGFAGVLFILTFVVLGVLAPNYSSVRETISSLEFTSLGLGQRINFFVFGLLLCAFGAGLREELNQGRGGLFIPFFQVLSGISVIGDAVFIHPPLHLVCDLIAFNSTLLVLFGFAWVFHQNPLWKSWTAYTIATALLMTALLTAFGFANHAGGPAGLMEKLATLVRTVWSVLFTGKLLLGSRV